MPVGLLVWAHFGRIRGLLFWDAEAGCGEATDEFAPGFRYMIPTNFRGKVKNPVCHCWLLDTEGADLTGSSIYKCLQYALPE